MKYLTTILSLPIIFFAFGCASMDVKEESVQMAGNIPKPTVIYVKPFEPGNDWKGDMENKSKEVFINEKMQDLTKDLIKHLSEIAPAQVASTSLPAQGLLVTGNLTHVDAGSGAARYWAGGFGAGAREVTGNVQIYDLARSQTSPVASFKIEGGSKGDGGILGGVEGLGTEWDRIGKETRDFILKRMQ